MRGYEHLETAESRVEFKSCLWVMITVFADQDLEESLIYSASLMLASGELLFENPLSCPSSSSGETPPTWRNRSSSASPQAWGEPPWRPGLAAVLAGKSFVWVLLFVFLQLLLASEELWTGDTLEWPLVSSSVSLERKVMVGGELAVINTTVMLD